MAERSYYRLFLIIGVVAIVAVLGGFIGVYLLFWALSTYGVWVYVSVAIVIFGLCVIWYIIESRRKKQVEPPAEPDMVD
jgi:Flp pilus assembly protein TadB